MNRRLDFTALVIFIASAIFATYLVYFHRNFLQLDALGHVASAQAFSEGRYHQWSDRIFLGYVHGLFYPPLEDFLLTLIHGIFRSWTQSYQFFVAALCWAVSISFWRLGLVFRGRVSKILVWFIGLAVVHTDTGSNFAFQGLSLTDTTATGLSSGALGLVFLLQLFREMLMNREGEEREPRLLIWTTLTLLSHLVAGMVAGLCILAFTIVLRSVRYFRVGVFALGLSAFFWLPFVLSRSAMTSAHITSPISLALPLALVLLVSMAFMQRSHRAFAVATLALIFSIPAVILILAPSWSESLPVFHYYRFDIFLILLGSLATALLLDGARWEAKPKMTATVALVCAALVTAALGLPSYPMSHPAWTPFRLPAVPAFSNGTGRTWSVMPSRSVDFSYDSWFGIQDASYRSVKGLYWESGRTNALLTSWIVSLTHLPGVLSFYKMSNYSCEIAGCLMDRYFHDYAIERVVAPRDWNLFYLNADQRSCFATLFKTGTPRSRFEKELEFSAQGQPFASWKVVPRDESASWGNRVVEWADPTRASWVRLGGAAKPYEWALERTRAGCERALAGEGEHFLDEGQVIPEGVGSAQQAQPRVISQSRGAEGRWIFEVPSSRPEWVAIKVAPFPGLKVFSESGVEVPTRKAYPYLLAQGMGKLELRFEKPASFWISELISILTAISLLVLRWRRRLAARS